MAEEMRGVPGEGTRQMQNLFGAGDENIRLLERQLGVHIALRGGEIVVEGAVEEAVDQAHRILAKMMALLARGERVDTAVVQVALTLAQKGELDQLRSLLDEWNYS